jgi:hypothetical protein
MRRIFGHDYARLREAGWKVEEIGYLAALHPDEHRRQALFNKTLYVKKKKTI